MKLSYIESNIEQNIKIRIFFEKRVDHGLRERIRKRPLDALKLEAHGAASAAEERPWLSPQLLQITDLTK